jgi:hypothetical protein
MIKLLDLLNEIQEEQQLDEGWKENIMAVAIAAASLVGNKAKGQDVLQKNPVAVTQQIKQANRDTLNLNFGTNFQSGKYTFNQGNAADLSDKLVAIGNFIKSHPNREFTVNIVSSESKVPNYDLEKSSPNFKSKLDTGQLAQKRAISMKLAIQTLVDKLKEEGIDVGTVNFNPAKTLVGGPEWKQGMKATDPKFTEHQYVKFQITSANKGFDYNAFSSDGESMFDERRHLIARAFVRTRETTDITKAGNTDTGHEDVLVRFVDKFGKFTGEDYLVDGLWWNKNKNINNVIDVNFKSKIEQVGKKVN